MTTNQIAKLCGIEAVKCGPGWDGPWGYKETKYHTCCGFKTKEAAVRSAVKNMCGGSVAGAVFFDLLADGYVRDEDIVRLFKHHAKLREKRDLDEVPY